MLDKLKNLFDLKSWIENFLLKTVLDKGVKHATTVVLGFLGSAIFTTKVKPILEQFGLTIDQAQLQLGLAAFFGGLSGWLMNWAIKVMDKDGDGKIG